MFRKKKKVTKYSELPNTNVTVERPTESDFESTILAETARSYSQKSIHDRAEKYLIAMYTSIKERAKGGHYSTYFAYQNKEIRYAMILDICKKILEKKGYEVICAEYESDNDVDQLSNYDIDIKWDPPGACDIDWIQFDAEEEDDEENKVDTEVEKENIIETDEIRVMNEGTE